MNKRNKKSKNSSLKLTNRRKITIWSIMSLTMLVALVFGLVFHFNTFGGGEREKDPVSTAAVSYKTIVENDLHFEPNKFESDGTTAASYKLVGFNGVGGNLTNTGSVNTAIGEYYALEVPSKFNGKPVTEIAVTVSGSAGVGGYPGSMMPQWFSGASGQVSRADNIRKIVVPKSVQKISVGAFNIFHQVEYMELPFVGTERGNRNDNASTGWQSSFYAIFGSQDYNPMSEYDFMELRSGGTLKTFDELTPNGGTGQIPWYYKLGQSQMPQEYLNVPVHLTEVYITDEYYIADHAFFESPALKKISIQWATNVPTEQFGACGFGAHIFDSSISLETVILPSRMSSYGEGMFNQAIALTTVAIGGKDYETEGDSGDAYRQLKSSIPAEGQVHLPLENVPRAVINSNTFNACRNIVNMVIPHSVVSIMDHAFDGCTAMSDVRSSAGTSVDSSSSKLKNCYLPENLEYIGTLAFRNCSSLQNINVPSNVKTIESMAFNHCTALQSITLPFIGKEAGNGNYDNSIYGDNIHSRHEELLEAMFGYIFGMYGEEGAGNLSDSTDTLVFQAVDGDPSTGRTGGDQTSRGYYYIPASLKNVTITSESVVAVGAFMNCRTIESLTITSFDENKETGYSNMKIGKGALYGCVNLSNLSIPFVGPNDRQLTKGQVKNGGGAINYQLGYIFGNHSHSDMTEIIQTAALGGTEKYYFPSQLSTVELTHQTYVSSHAFYRVTSLETVIIGQKTKGIQRGIFTGNTNLTNLEVPFVGVGRGPYYNGTGIYFENDHWYGDYWWGEDYRIRNSLIWLFTNGTGNNMYYNEYITSWRHEWDCYVPNAFKNLTITDDYYLDTNAIRGFSSLQSVEIQVGPSVDIAKMHIDSSILYGCSNIRTLKLPFIGKDRNRDSVNSRDYTIGYLFGTTSFGNTYRALQGVGSSATYYIPKTLTTIEFENYMTCIADGAFRGMSSLVSVASPGKDGADIQQLGSYAFDGCTELLFVNIPNASYTYMGNYAFQNCRALTRISEFSPNTVTQIGHGALKGTSIYEVDLKKYYFLGDYAFADCLQISTIDFTDAASQCVDATHRNLEYVGSHLFDGCTTLSDVTLLPMNATKQYVSAYMLANCTSLRTINLQGKLSTIPEGFLMGCTNLQSYHIDYSSGTAKDAGLILYPETCGVTTIGPKAFMNCKSLDTFILPEDLQSIGNSAFQNCIGLNSLRIPRKTTVIPLGTEANGTDNYTTGVFYGCDEKKFYLEVFYPESQWFSTWGKNWNCYFPVYIIGDQDENIFTYEYCSDLRGYLINGLNLRSAQNPEGVDFTTADNRLKYKDTLIFPATHNGLTVYGLTEDCFSDYEVVAIYGDNTTALPVHPFNDIKNFVLGINFVTIGEDAFNFEEYPIYRNIFSQVPSSQAKRMLGKVCHCHDGNPEDISHNRYTGLHYDEEGDYAYNSIVYYKEAWTFKSGTQTPVFTLDALNFVLDSDSYQYALGKKVEPKIVDVLVNDAFVKYPDGDETYAEYDEIHRTFYPVDDDELDLSSVSIQYSNNVNVGTGKMTIISACAGLTGSKEISFAITAMQIDAFYEAGKKANTYGTSNGMPEDADGTNSLRAQDHFANIITNDGNIINPTWNNKVNFPNFREVVVLEPEYDGTAWTNSRWAVGDNIFGLPNGYHMSGVISTTSHEVGYYWVEEDVIQMFALGAEDALHPGEKINNISGFKWTTRPVITDSNGNDVTRNFKVVVTLAVYIKPFVITEVTWPGAKGDDGITYEYEYTGAAIVPVPTVVNANGKELNPRFTVEVTNGPALIPSAQIYEARVTSYDTRNFRYNVYSHGPQYDYNYIQFKVIPARLHIRMEVTNYLIGENELEFSFSDFKNWKNYQISHNMKITGLGLNSYLSGRIYTTSDTDEKGWSNKTYIGTDDTSINRDYKILWDFVNHNGPKVYIDDNDGDSTNDFDATAYYTITYELSVKIEWNRFNYNYTISTPGMADHVITGVDIGMGIHAYNESATKTEIEYGTDGYRHTIDIKFNNVANPAGVRKEMITATDNASTFTFEDFGVHTFTLYLSKDRFYPVSKEVEILVTKGRYTFSSLSKEYDREAVNPIDHIIRRPKDLDVSKLDFTYYMRNDTKYTTPLAAAPFEIGYYKFTLTTQTGHSEFFEDCEEWPRYEKDNSVADFRISPRSLIIKVLDDIAPYDEKQYDGYPWSKSYIAATEPSLNLLPGDSLTGAFMTRSAEIGVYDGSNSADFVTSGAPWKINNSTLGEQTSNYTLVFDGIYKILPRNLDWDVEGVDTEYDGKYYTVNVKVREPLYGYTIYCSEKELPLDSSEWSLYPSIFHTEPGTYTIYVKLVAPHYQSEYKSAVITIHGKEILWDVDDDTASYDGYPHKLTTASVQEPWHATIEYAVIPNDYKNSDLENLVLSTTCPSFVEPGTYTYYVQVSAQNYEPDYRIVTLDIDNNGPKQNISISGETVIYDGKYHGPIFDFTYANVDPSQIEVSYYVGDNTVVNPQWITVTLDEREDGTYYIPLYVNACSITGGNVTPYTVTVRTLAKGYGISSVTVDIIISPLEFNLGVVPYSKVFDNKYHTLFLKGTNPDHRLEIISDLEETTPVLKYRYYFDTDPESSNFVDLDVRYSETPPMGGNTAGYLPKILRYKDVGQYQVFIYVQAPNCKPVFLSGEVNILFNNNPKVEFDPNPFDVEYLAKPIELEDMPFETVHDGNPVLEYRFYKRDGDTWQGDGISFNSEISKNTIAAPQDLGEYQLEITYFETRNCAEVTKKVNFRIVPRRLIIEYEKELEYTGDEMLPEVTAITNTSDTVKIRPEAVGGVIPKDIGDYEMDIYIQRDSIYQEVNENYFIHPDDQRLPFSIIARNIYISITDKMIYDAGNKWSKDTGWVVENILPNDEFRLTLETSRGQAATYGTIGYMTYIDGNYKDNLVLSGTTTTVFAYDVVVKELEILHEVDGVWVDAPYYKVNLGAFITIAYPDFDVEVDSPTFDYDGKDHSFTPTISSKAINYWSLFWLISPEDYDTKDPYDLVTIDYEEGTVTGPTNNPTNTFSQINVGEYYVLYAFGARNFSPKVGFAKLTIEKILLDIIVEKYEKVYDAQVHQAPYEILNLDEIPKSPTPEYYYIPQDAVDESGYSVVEIKDFFRAGKPKDDPIFALYNKSVTSLRDQGTFLAVVYYEDSLNWGRSVGTETVTIKRRPLYFNYLPTEDFKLEVYYDGTKPIVWMGDFEYDTAETSQNKTNPDAGLIRGHQILCSSMAENAFCTYEPDCRGEADNKPWDEPYQRDGDFEFYKMNIQNGQGVNFADNYYPVFNTNPDGSYHVMIIIKRINLPEFEVWDYVPRLYDKKDALPHTSIDENYRGVGDFIYYFYKVYKVGDNAYQYFEFVSGSSTTALATLHEKDVTTKFQVDGNIVDGYYQVFISVADGRNYYGWTGDSDWDPNGGITNQNVFGTDSETGMNGNSQYSFKSAYVQVIPRTVDLKWESLDEIFKLDESGNIVYYTPKVYFEEPDGNKIYVTNIDIYDPETGHILTDEYGVKARSIARSGSYPLIAHFSSNNYVIRDNSATFNIAKRVYKISETLSEPWLHTYWNKAYTESYFIDHPEENELDWLPGFTTRVVVSTIANKAGVYYRGNHFQKQALVLDSSGDDYTDCFEFVLDLYLNLTSNELIVQDEYTETYYDENYHWPKIDILSHMNGYVMSYDVIMVRPDGSYYPSEDVDQGTHVINYQASLPTTLENPETLIRHTVFKDIGRYRVFYRVVLGNEKEDDESTVDIKYGTVDVNILQNQSELSFANTGLDRIYNGKAPTILDLQNTIVGRYNGSRGNLIISYREKGSSVDLSDAPIDVGEYEIVVRSSADGNPNYIQNYTELDAHYEFTIRPREITLNVNTDWQVSEDILNNSTYRWASNGINPSNGTLPANGYVYGDGISQIQNNLSSNSSKYWITQGTNIGLVTSDFLTFQVKSTSYLPRGKYYYKDAQLHDTGFAYSYKTGDFELEWNIYYNGDTTRDKTANYRLILDFALDVHYPYMTVNPQDTEYDYTGSPYDLLGNNPANNGKKNIEIVQPATGWTILYGDNNNNVTLSSWQRTNPGTYRAYYRITAQGYEDYEGSTIMKIRFKTRDDMLKIDRDLGKTYDNVAYDKDAVLLQDDDGYLIQIDWKDPSEVIPYESLPTDRSTWKIEYFIAEQDRDGKWKKIGDALDSVIDAGDYFYRLTIPAGDYYAETILERHFTIERRLYTIGNPADKPVITKIYDGLPWTYNIATNNDAFEIEGLLPNHKITVGTLYTNAVNVGVYNASNLAGNRVMMLFNSGTDYILWDSENNCDVRDNYRYEINVSIEILKADMNLAWPTQTEYYYPGPTGWITPVATLIVPNQYSSKIEYSIDGVKWRSEPYSFREVKDDYYKVTARVQNVPNYNNCEQDYFFKILKESNKLEMDDISRPYNGDPIAYPYIMTYGWTGAVNTNKDVIFKWLEYNEGTGLYEETANNGTTRPIEVGKYGIDVTFPETDNYGYIARRFYFEITKLVLTAQWSNQNLTYNAEEQDLALKLTSNDYPSLNVLGMLKKDIDYTLVYTNTDTGVDLPGKPKDVGHYKVTFTLKPIAYKNYEFADELDFAYQYFDINKCRVVVSYTGVFNFDGNPITITRSQLKIEGLPAIVDFQSGLVTQGTGPGNFDTTGNYLTSNFNEKYLWTTSTGNAMNPVLNNISTGNPEDCNNNYEIYVNMNMRVASGVLVYSVSAYEGTYDGDYHSFDFTITPEPTDIVSWEYSVDGGANYTAELPKYRDAMASPVHIVVRVKSLLYGNPNNNYYLYLGDNPASTDYDEFKISIGKADTILEDRVYNLDKIYDAQVVQNPEIFYNGDERNSYLHFDYYYMEKEGEGYQPVDIVRSRSVGDYKLIVWMEESPNYKGTDMGLTKPDATAPLEIIFKISPRVIVISMEPDSKVYDGSVWSARLNSADSDSEAKFLPVVGIPESGLINGHIFNGTVKTNGVNADEYKTQGRFQMEDGWGIKDNLGVDVTRNYDVRLDLHVTIEEAQFDVTAENIERIYRKGDLHHIEVVFNTEPKVPCSLDELITYYSPSDEEMANGIDTAWNDLSKFTTNNPEFESGFHTVYFIIQYPNYRTYYGQATVYIKPLTSSISVDSYKGKFTSDSKVYDGYEYETGSIEISMADGSPMLDRTPSYEFYDSSKNKLSYIPIDVGTYYFRVHLSADSANIYEECWSEYCQFSIIPQTVEIDWSADIEKALADGTIDYQMIYVDGQMVLAPTPVAEDDQGRILDLEITDENGDPVDSKLSGGPYWIVASLKHVKDQQNYRLKNDRIMYKITAQPGGYIPGPPGGGPYPPFPPEPETPLPPIDGDYVGIVFKTPDQENMKTKLNYDYRELMDEKLLYIEATFVTRNGSTSYVLTVDAMTGEVTEVNGYQVPSTGYFNFYFSIPMTKDSEGNDIPDFHPRKTEIQAILRDPFNTAWNTDGDTDPVKINLLIDPTSLNDKKPDPDPDDDPDNPKDLVPDIIVYEDSYEKTQIWSEWADKGEVTPEFTVAITNGTLDRSDDIILVKDVHYTVEWYENDHVSQSWERGYFVVKSIDAGGYEFQIGEYKPTVPNPYQYGAGSFQIINSLPNRFEIINGSKYVFEKFEQNFEDLSIVTTILSNEDRTAELDGATAAELAASMIRLSHTYQGQSVWWMLEQLINKNEDIVVYDALGDIIFEVEPGSTESLKEAEAVVKTIRITGGMKLALYKNGLPHTTENQLDVIEVILRGDVDRDGYINNNDILISKDYINKLALGMTDDLDENILTSTYYQSGLLSEAAKMNNNDILKMKNHIQGASIHPNTLGVNDINNDYYEENAHFANSGTEETE